MKTKILHLLGLLILMLLPTWAFAQTTYDKFFLLSEIHKGKATIHVDSLLPYVGAEEPRDVLIRVKNGAPLEITFPEDASQITRKAGRMQITSSNTVIINEPISFMFSYMQNGIKKEASGNVNYFGVAMFDGKELNNSLCFDGEIPEKYDTISITTDEDLNDTLFTPPKLYPFWFKEHSITEETTFAKKIHNLSLKEVLGNIGANNQLAIAFSDGSNNKIADPTAPNGFKTAGHSFYYIMIIDKRPPNAISTVEKESEMPLAIYNLQGHRIPALQQGLNLLLYPSGRREKVYLPWGFPLQI